MWCNRRALLFPWALKHKRRVRFGSCADLQRPPKHRRLSARNETFGAERRQSILIGKRLERLIELGDLRNIVLNRNLYVSSYWGLDVTMELKRQNSDIICLGDSTLEVFD